MTDVRLHLPSKAVRAWELEPGWRATVFALRSGEACWTVAHWPATARIRTGRIRHAGWFVLGRDGKPALRSRPGHLRRLPPAWARAILASMVALHRVRSAEARSASAALFGVDPVRMADNPMR